jgi:hypothetical protein
MSSRMSPATILEIRKALEGGATRAEVAQQYGLHPGYVSRLALNSRRADAESLVIPRSPRPRKPRAQEQLNEKWIRLKSKGVMTMDITQTEAMTIEGLEAIEADCPVTAAYKPPTKSIGAKGTDAAIDRFFELIEGRQEEVALLLRQRQGLPLIDEEPIVEREIPIPTNVPALAVQEANYYRWTMEHSRYFQPSEEERKKMFSVLQEGDLVLPDFAHSFSVRRPNGLVVQVDRKGRISAPSPYSPAVRGK